MKGDFLTHLPLEMGVNAGWLGFQFLKMPQTSVSGRGKRGGFSCDIFFRWVPRLLPEDLSLLEVARG